MIVFRKIWFPLFFVTPVLRLTLLPYYRQLLYSYGDQISSHDFYELLEI